MRSLAGGQAHKHGDSIDFSREFFNNGDLAQSATGGGAPEPCPSPRISNVTGLKAYCHDKGLLMDSSRAIWNHEVSQAERIARALLEKGEPIPLWKRIFFPRALGELIGGRRKIKTTRQNLLFTKGLAFQAAKAVEDGDDAALTLGRVDATTREVLRGESEGLYNETIRRKQLKEIELLFDHYLKLVKSPASGYDSKIRDVYPSVGEYWDFLKRLEKRESDVIQASITTVKKGSKKERFAWYNRVQEKTREARKEEVERIFS